MTKIQAEAVANAAMEQGINIITRMNAPDNWTILILDASINSVDLHNFVTALGIIATVNRVTLT